MTAGHYFLSLTNFSQKSHKKNPPCRPLDKGEMGGFCIFLKCRGRCLPVRVRTQTGPYRPARGSCKSFYTDKQVCPCHPTLVRQARTGATFSLNEMNLLFCSFCCFLCGSFLLCWSLLYYCCFLRLFSLFQTHGIPDDFGYIKGNHCFFLL